MKSEIKVGKSTKVLKPGHTVIKKGKNVKVEKQDSEDDNSDNNYDDVDQYMDEYDDYDVGEPVVPVVELGAVAPFSEVDVLPSTSSTIPMNSKKSKPRKRKTANIDLDNDMGVFNDLPEVHASDSDGEDALNHSDPIKENDSRQQSFLNVKKEKEDFDFTIFGEKDEILNNLISESSENDPHNIKLEPIYKVELAESHHALGSMVDPLVSFLYLLLIVFFSCCSLGESYSLSKALSK